MQDKNAENKKRSITLNLDGLTIDKLKELADSCGYDSISGSIRILVKKYADKELKLIRD